MCEPVSLMSLAVGGLSIGASLFSAAGQVTAGTVGAQVANINATAYEDQANLRIMKGEYDAVQAQNKFRRAFGNAVASGAASGIDLQSFGDVFADMATESALEEKSIRFGAAKEAENLRLQAAGQRLSGEAAEIGGTLGATGTILGGLGKAGGDMFLDRRGGSGTIGFNRKGFSF